MTTSSSTASSMTTSTPEPTTAEAPAEEPVLEEAPVEEAPLLSSRSTKVAPAPTPVGEAPAAVSYANCTEVRNAGAAPMYQGQPGYASHLDRDGDGDGDGIGCE
jgi:hypothetical protein